MSTNTANYNLVKPSGDPGGDLVDITVLDADLDIIDTALHTNALHGVQVCTSAARPSTELFDGMIAHETDTDRYIGWDGAKWRPISPNTKSVRQVIAANNDWTNQVAYGVLPNATDRTALTMTFNKISDATDLEINFNCTMAFISGAAQLGVWGLRVGVTDSDVAQFRWEQAGSVVPARFPLIGTRRISGAAAGDLTIEPVFKNTAAGIHRLWAGDDVVSYQVREV